MNRKRFLALTAEHALSTGLPLHEELAAAETHVDSRALAAAREQARAGNLSVALTYLPIDPVISAAALIDPKAVAAAGRRVRALPTRLSLLFPVLLPCLYLSAVLGAILLALRFSDWRMLSMFSGIPGYSGPVSADALQAAAAASLVFLWGVPSYFVIRRGRSGVAAHVLELNSGARLFAVAAELGRCGIEPARALPALSGRAGLRSDVFGSIALGPGAIDAAACEAASRWLASEAERRVWRIATATTLAGTMTAVAIAFLFLRSVYLAISGIPGGMFP